MEKPYTTQELANIFKIDEADVHSYLIKNKIPFIKVSRDYLISDMDLSEKKGSIRRKRD